MRLLALVMLIICAQTVQADLLADYNVIVEENGNALVTLVITGYGTLDVPLPLDVATPAVRDALYVKEKGGVEVSIDADGQSTIVYKTSLICVRDGGSWRFSLDLPDFERSTIIVHMPATAQIEYTTPNAALTAIGGSKSIIWNVKSDVKRIEAGYVFGQVPVPDDGNQTMIYMVLIFVIPFLLTLAIVLYASRRKGEIRVSQGKQNVLKTLSANESKIVSQLLHNGGGMRRNELEQGTGISKSSLASALHNLEHKNIVHVNRSEAVHFVSLTEWFKAL